MQELYAAIEVYKSLNQTKETINYYIIKDKNYGIKIAKENDEIIIQDIANEKQSVEKLLNEIISGNIDISQISYIIEDYKQTAKYKNYQAV